MQGSVVGMRVGVDMVEIARMASAARKSSTFLKRTFTGTELRDADELTGARRNEYLAGRFAAKEAVLKALRVGIAEIRWLKQIEVSYGPGRSPMLTLSGAVSALAAESGFSNWQVSISHEAGLAMAVVLLS